MALKADIQSRVQDNRTIKTAHSAETVAGYPVLVGGRVCVPLHSKDADVANVFVDDCPALKAPKTSALAITAGDKLYWDDTAKEFNKTSDNNTYAGRAVEDAANPSAYVIMHLMRMQA